MPLRRSPRLAQAASETFTPFTKFPPEIQKMIYKEDLLAARPRFITIHLDEGQIRQADLTTYPDLHGLDLPTEELKAYDPSADDVVFTFKKAIAIQTIPALLHTCRIARETALEHYQIKYWNRCEGMSIIINFDIDTLYFTSYRAWLMFTRTLHNAPRIFVKRALVPHTGEDKHSQLAVDYNILLCDQLKRERIRLKRDMSCIDEMADNVKFLAFGVNDPNMDGLYPQMYRMHLDRFWKLKMLCINPKKHLSRRYFRHLQFDEKLLILKWRWRISGTRNREEWLARQEESPHITLPRVEYVTDGTMQIKQRLDEGLDMEFEGVPHPPNPY
ncbi:hypothetical protein NHQ30_008586 [Ciborinia camelliae]|nr:hypothetical protein NHQ30_008586 [Ciborinia camelliae]